MNSFWAPWVAVATVVRYGSLYTNDKVLLFYHVLQECPSSAWSNELYVHIFLTCARRRKSGELCAGDFNYVCVWVWYPQSDHLVVGSMWYRQTVWEAHRVFSFGTVYCDCWLWEYLRWQSVSRKWGPFGPTDHVVFTTPATLDGTMCPRWQGPDKTHVHMYPSCILRVLGSDHLHHSPGPLPKESSPNLNPSHLQPLPPP